MKNYAYLVYVDPLANSNKYYEIKQNDNNSIDVTYGRVGGRASFHHYASGEKDFYMLLHSKESKGYVDVTALHSSKVVTNHNTDLDYKPIEHEEINALIEMLAKSAREFMQTNYTIKSSDITQKMVDEAQNDLNELVDMVNNMPNVALWRFNDKLVEIFTDIPRKMKNVDDYTAKSTSDFLKIIAREQDMIDNVKGQIAPQITTSVEKDKTLLEAYGLSVRSVTYKEEDEITSHLGKDYDGREVESRYVKGYAVENQKTRSAYEDFKQSHNLTQKDCRLFYHGSKVENWLSIMKSGLSLNPNAKITGKMFGNGLYFAPDSRKSLNYMDVKGAVWNDGKRDSGYVAVYSVALGECYKPVSSLSRTFNKDSLPSGCLSVFADKIRTGLKNDEYVVYDQAQCTIKYLLEMNAHTKDMDFSFDRKHLINTMSKGMDELIRIPNGVRAEFDLSKYDLRKESWGRVLYDNFDMCHVDVDKLYVDYNIKHDSITFTVADYNQSICEYSPVAIGSLTRDDAKFMCREMKKVFAKSEDEWKSIIRDAEKTMSGYLVASKLPEEKEQNTRSRKSIERD